jgi:hypothetical protein
MIEELLKSIAQNGLLGVLLVISFVAIYFLYCETRKERDGRLTDMKELLQKDADFRSELKQLVINILDMLRSGKGQ